ncbi:hypothetical protein FSP39_002868, partial [Pinctada imbricata]
DLVFVLDTSRSVWRPDFKRQLQFVEKVISEFTIGPGQKDTRIGVLTFAQTFYIQFYLKTYTRLNSVKRAVRFIRHRQGYRTNTASALKFLSNYMFKPRYGGRPNATHVAIVVTDGESQSKRSTKAAAKAAKESGIQIFAIGVGMRTDYQELRSIGSDPEGKHVFRVNRFSELGTIKDRLPRNACEVKSTPKPTTTTVATTTTTTTTTTAPPTTTTIPQSTTTLPKKVLLKKYINDIQNLIQGDDPNAGRVSYSDVVFNDSPKDYCREKDAEIYFVLDSSSSIWPINFQKQLSFVNDMIDYFEIDNTKSRIRVGVVVYSTTIKNVIALNSKRTRDQIKRQINETKYLSGRTNTSDAISFVREYGFRKDVVRKGAVKIAIVMTDGISRNPNATQRESDLSKAAGIHLFAIGIGDKVDKTELETIANDPDDKYVFKVENFGGLGTIKELLAISACAVIPDMPQNIKRCDIQSQADIMFIYDAFSLGARKSEMIGNFVHDVISTINSTSGGIQFGRLTDNCPSATNIPMGSPQTAFTRMNFPGIGKMLGDLKAYFPGRPWVKKLGILIVDESTQGVDDARKVMKQTSLDPKFDLMVVSIGDQNSIKFAEDLATDPDINYLIPLSRFADLPAARDKIIAKLCDIVKPKSKPVPRSTLPVILN